MNYFIRVLLGLSDVRIFLKPRNIGINLEKSNIALCFLLCSFSTMSCSQNSYDKVWELVTYTGKYAQWLYMVEPQLRFIKRSYAYEQFLLNVGGGVNVTPHLQFWLGQTFTNLSAFNAIAEDVASNDTNEYRNWQQLFWTSPFYESTVALRTRLEERFSLENAPWAVRLRERGYWTIPLTKRQSIVLSDEILVNLKLVDWITTKTFDQNRAYIGIQHNLTPATSFTLSYMNQYIFKNPPENNHAIVLNVFVNFA